jgi:hypothetical protein
MKENNSAKDLFWDLYQHSLAEYGANQDAYGAQNQISPHLRELPGLAHEVHGHARGVYHECDCGGGCHKTFLFDVKSEQRSRADAA